MHINIVCIGVYATGIIFYYFCDRNIVNDSADQGKENFEIVRQGEACDHVSRVKSK